MSSKLLMSKKRISELKLIGELLSTGGAPTMVKLNMVKAKTFHCMKCDIYVIWSMNNNKWCHKIISQDALLTKEIG